MTEEFFDVGVNGSTFVGYNFTVFQIGTKLRSLASHPKIRFHFLHRDGVSHHARKFVLAEIPEAYCVLYSLDVENCETLHSNLQVRNFATKQLGFDAWQQSFRKLIQIWVRFETFENGWTGYEDTGVFTDFTDDVDQSTIVLPRSLADSFGQQLEIAVGPSLFEQFDGNSAHSPTRFQVDAQTLQDDNDDQPPAKVMPKSILKKSSRYHVLFPRNRELVGGMEIDKYADTTTPQIKSKGSALTKAMRVYKKQKDALEVVLEPKRLIDVLTYPHIDNQRSDADLAEPVVIAGDTNDSPPLGKEILKEPPRNEFDSSSSSLIDERGPIRQAITQNLPSGFKPDEDVFVDEQEIEEKPNADDDSFIENDLPEAPSDSEDTSEFSGEDSSDSESEESASESSGRKKKRKIGKSAKKVGRPPNEKSRPVGRPPKDKSRPVGQPSKEKSRPVGRPPKKAKKEFVAAPTHESLKSVVASRHDATINAILLRDEFVKDIWLRADFSIDLLSVTIDMRRAGGGLKYSEGSDALQQMCRQPTEEWPATSFYGVEFALIKSLWLRIGPVGKTTIMQELFLLASIDRVVVDTLIHRYSEKEARVCFACGKTHAAEHFGLYLYNDGLSLAVQKKKFPTLTAMKAFDRSARPGYHQARLFLGRDCGARIRKLVRVHNFVSEIRKRVRSDVVYLDFTTLYEAFQWLMREAQEQSADSRREDKDRTTSERA
jgi:hypothetical protein